MESLIHSHYHVGRTGSCDRVLLRWQRGFGLYLSLRLVGRCGITFAFGPGYLNRVYLRGLR